MFYSRPYYIKDLQGAGLRITEINDPLHPDPAAQAGSMSNPRIPVQHLNYVCLCEKVKSKICVQDVCEDPTANYCLCYYK